ncbi:MAG: beta-propeller domain-containing protein, partial [Planctomycetota bacterium]
LARYWLVGVLGLAIGVFLRFCRVALVTDFYWPTGGASTVITVLDVSDRSAPVLVQSTEIDGRYVESRRVDDDVLVVTDAGPVVLPAPMVDCDLGCQQTETVEEYRARMEENFGSILESILPGYYSLDSDGEIARQGMLVEPEDIYRPLTEDSQNLVSVTSINMASDEPGLSSTQGVFTSGASNIHGTREAIYVLDNHYDRDALDDNQITRIMKFDWDASRGELQFTSVGQVSGSIHDQFSVDEHDGFLRVAANIRNTFSGNFSNRAQTTVFVLQQDEGVLEVVSSAQNVGLNEQVESVRFSENRVLVTTFRQVDPLFGVDLSNPLEPDVVGALTIPGYSSYLQFIDEDHVLAIGQNSAVERRGAAAVSLFNVEDLANPRLVDQMNFPRFADSLAEADHHAFGWFGFHSQLAVPARRNTIDRVDTDGDGYAEERVFRVEDEMYVWNVDPSLGTEAIELAGTLTHDSGLLRTAFIGDQLYAISTNRISAVPTSDPSQVTGTVQWETDDSPEPGLWEREEIGDEIARREAFVGDASSQLASRLGTSSTDVMPVAIESSIDRPGDVLMVLRHNDVNYLYKSVDDAVEFVQSNFDYGNHNVRHNVGNPVDTNGDGVVSPIDALFAVNRLDGGGEVVRQVDAGSDGAFVDVNNDGVFSPIDALLAVNGLNGSESPAAPVVPNVETPQSVDSIDEADEDGFSDANVVATTAASVRPLEMDGFTTQEDEAASANLLIDRVFASDLA